LDASKIQAGLDKAEQDLKRLGYDIEMCLTDTGETAEDVVGSRLREKQFDCIIIGAGIRVVATYFLLFEKLINVVHENAPQAKICFNTTPNDSPEAVQRWI
jgi:DNA-binding LacI/PurR family transcriptional regulator